MPNVPEMLKERPHMNNELQSAGRLAGFLEEVDGHLADLGRRIVELSDEKAKGPLVGVRCGENELSKVLSRVETDVLEKTRREGSAEVRRDETGES